MLAPEKSHSRGGAHLPTSDEVMTFIANPLALKNQQQIGSPEKAALFFGAGSLTITSPDTKGLASSTSDQGLCGARRDRNARAPRLAQRAVDKDPISCLVAARQTMISASSVIVGTMMSGW